MRIYLLFLIVCIFLFSCKKVEAPISKNLMISILVDMHTSEAATVNIDPHIKDSLSKVYLDEILQIHKVSKTDFDQSLAMYDKNPKQMEVMYDSVLARIDAQSAK